MLVTTITDPDWEPIMKEAAAIVTDRGGRTSHAAIVARELGIPAVVGTENATRVLKTGQEVTVSCAEGEDGKAYEGRPALDVREVDPQTPPPAGEDCTDPLPITGRERNAQRQFFGRPIDGPAEVIIFSLALFQCFLSITNSIKIYRQPFNHFIGNVVPIGQWRGNIK